MGPRACSAPNCKNNATKNKGLSFRTPKGERGKKWIVNARREDLLEEPSEYLYENIKFCALHFERSQFMNDKRNSLVRDAVPTLFNIRNPPKPLATLRPNPLDRVREEQVQAQKQTAEKNARKTLQYIKEQKQLYIDKRRKRKLQSESTKYIKRIVKAKKQAIYRLYKRQTRLNQGLKGNRLKVEAIIDSIKHHLTSDKVLLLRTRLKNTRRKQNIYCEDYKRLAVSLAYKSNSAYRYLARRLKLPPKRTVMRWISNIRFSEGFNESVFKLLQEKTKKMETRDRFASLLLDEVSLREHCQYDASEDKIVGAKRKKDGSFYFPSTALVLMATGLKAKWRQTLAYFFTKNAMTAKDLLGVVFEAITKLDEVGVRVVNVTCDQGSNNWAMTSLLGATPEKPFFHHLGRKIFFSPDPPHLIKSCRNCLLEHNIMTKDGLASWMHLRAFYNQDKLGTLRMAKKLTDEHLDPPPIYGKMIVRYATQVLSHSVAKGMQSCVLTKTLSKMVLPTSLFCEQFDTLFDIMNVSRPRDPKPFKRGLHPGNKDQQQFLDDSIKYIRGLKVMNKEGKVINNHFRWMDGMVMAITSLKMLCFDMCENQGFDFLLSRRLNQDPLENYFSIIRQRNGFDNNPSCYGFATAFKITMVN